MMSLWGVGFIFHIKQLTGIETESYHKLMQYIYDFPVRDDDDNNK